MATVWAITLPANVENWAQFVPNWNSIGMPVTTPTMKLAAKMRLQKRTAWLAVSSWRRIATDLRITSIKARPMVRGGNR